MDVEVGVDTTSHTTRSFYDGHGHPFSLGVEGWHGRSGSERRAVQVVGATRTNHPTRRRDVPLSKCRWSVTVDDVLQRHGSPSQTGPASTPEAIQDQQSSGGPSEKYQCTGARSGQSVALLVTRDEALAASDTLEWEERCETARVLARYTDDASSAALGGLLLDGQVGGGNWAFVMEAAQALLGRDDLYGADLVFAVVAPPRLKPTTTFSGGLPRLRTKNGASAWGRAGLPNTGISKEINFSTTFLMHTCKGALK